MDKLFQPLLDWLKRLRFIVIVGPWEQAVRVRFGKQANLLGPGVHWIVPILDRIYILGVQRRSVNIPMQTMTTLDGETVTCGGAVGFHIRDLVLLYNTLHSVDDAVIQYAQAEVAGAVARSTKESLDPIRIANEIAPAIRKRLEGYGLGDVDVIISDFMRVKTFRLIQDQKYSSYSDVLTLKSETTTRTN